MKSYQWICGKSCICEIIVCLHQPLDQIPFYQVVFFPNPWLFAQLTIMQNTSKLIMTFSKFFLLNFCFNKADFAFYLPDKYG
ncbi:hypothetical protein ACFOG5_24515 [Pedobacter fastidiosus]|uniref:hypothetical protein n=1 Tax=Pedobacter fastidiosus TaxID=2765361 RepID=UPI003607E656